MIRSLYKLGREPLASLLQRHLALKSYLLRGGRVVNSDLSERADVLIKDGRIDQVAPTINAETTAEVINC